MMVGSLIGPHATVEKGVVLPDGAQLGQRLPLSTLNPEFFERIYVSQRRQVLVVGPVGSRADMLTAVYGQGPGHNETYCYTGCFGGTLEMLEDAVVNRKQEADPNREQYRFTIALVRLLAPFRSGVVANLGEIFTEY